MPNRFLGMSYLTYGMTKDTFSESRLVRCVQAKRLGGPSVFIKYYLFRQLDVPFLQL